MLRVQWFGFTTVNKPVKLLKKWLLKKEGIDYLKVPLSPMPHELIDPS
jgi:hypothetical protein